MCNILNCPFFLYADHTIINAPHSAICCFHAEMNSGTGTMSINMSIIWHIKIVSRTGIFQTPVE